MILVILAWDAWLCNVTCRRAGYLRSPCCWWNGRTCGDLKTSTHWWSGNTHRTCCSWKWWCCQFHRGSRRSWNTCTHGCIVQLRSNNDQITNCHIKTKISTCTSWFVIPISICLTCNGSSFSIIAAVGHLITWVVGSIVTRPRGKWDTSRFGTPACRKCEEMCKV